MWSKYLSNMSNNVWRDFRLPMSALATVAGKSFNGKFTAKIDFPMRYLFYQGADAGIGSLKSLHTLFHKYLDHMLVKFEQNRAVRTIQFLELFDQKKKKKMINHFWQSVDAILETFLWLKQ